MFCFVLLMGHNIFGTELVAGLCKYKNYTKIEAVRLG